jgi:hypothetical protein
MSRPVVHLRFGRLSITRAKLLFAQALLSDPSRLKKLELRLGVAVMSTYRHKAGYGEQSIEYFALALGADKSSVSRAARGLERAGYFRIERGVRGSPNRYYPNWDKVTSLQPWGGAP